MVPPRWRRESLSFSSGVGPLPVVRRTGGDRASPSSGSWCAGDRAAAAAQPVDDLAGAAPERVDADVAARVQGIDRAVACRASRPPAEGGEAGRERAAPRVRAGAAVGCEFAVAGGRAVGPPGPKWSGRNKPHRGDRRWVQGWSPEQIASRLRVEFPDDQSMRISHEAIYQALYVQGRGALKRELVACLRTGRALRVPRARARQKAWAHVTPEVMISERPAEADDRAVPGHWEGDLLIGLERSAIGTLVERTTRFTMLIHLPREDGYGTIPRTKNGPALAGYGAVTMKNALASTMTTLPEQLRRSLTWDRGKELSQHAAFKVETGIPVYFADPQSPWQRGTNENTNGLLRQYFPKGTDLSRWSADELEAVAAALNSRPAQDARLANSCGSARSSIYSQVNKPVLRRPVEPGLACRGRNGSPCRGSASRCSIAIPSALQVSAAVWLWPIDQPTTRRLNASSTTAQ